MFKNKELKNILSVSEYDFIKQLSYWIENKNKYGVCKDQKIWIYNTLEQWAMQLRISKSSVRRAIKSLKEKELIQSDYLFKNKRNRTLFYTINYSVLNKLINDNTRNKSEYMNEHMYIIDNSKQKINKSYKSEKDIFVNHHISSQRPKTSIVQDMIKILHEEISKVKITNTKQLSKFLVAAFKIKFNSCLKEWRKYLHLLKTSVYLMSDNFHLSIWWIIKFLTIDRIREGELGVNEKKIPVDEEEREKQCIVFEKEIEALKESSVCKDIRKKLLWKDGPIMYSFFLKKVSLCEAFGKIEALGKDAFVVDWVNQKMLR